MIHGIDIQFLDGAECCTAYTDEGIHGIFDRVRKGISTQAARQAIATKKIIENPVTRSMPLAMRKRFNTFRQEYPKQVASDVDSVLKGLDFAGFAGNGSVEDDEMLLNHLVRTKYIAERSPVAISGYQNPAAFNQMLGYVIDNWDTPDREKALEIAAVEEERLIANGAIQMPENDNNYEILYGDEIDANLFSHEEYEVSKLGTVRLKRSKSGFFNTVKKLNSNAALTNPARTLKNEVQDAFMRKKIGKKRSTIAKSRRKISKQTVTAVSDTTPENLTPEQPEQKTITQEVAQTADVVNGLGSTHGIEEQFDDVYRGLTLVGALGAVGSAEADTQAVKHYLLSVKQVMAQSPQEFFDSKEEAKLAIGSIDYMTVNWDNPITRIKAIDNLIGKDLNTDQYDELLCGICGIDGLGALGKGVLKKVASKVKGAVKKVATATKNAVKTAATVTKAAIIPTKKNLQAAKNAIKTQVTNIKNNIKNAAKKVGNFVKKVVKAVIKFNPISLLARGGILAAMRINLFKMAERLYPAVAPAEAKAAGASDAQINAAKEALEKTAKIYADRLKGKRDKLETAIRKGAKKKWKGGETFNQAELDQAEQGMSPAEQAEIEAEMQADKQELINSGAQFDETGTNPDMVVEQHPNGIEVEVAVAGLAGMYASGENEGLGVVGIAAASSIIVAMLGVIGAIIKKKTSKIENDTVNDQINYQNSLVAQQNDVPEGDYEEYYEPTADEQSWLDQLTYDPTMINNPLIQQAIAANPKLANNPAVQAAQISQGTQAGGTTKGGLSKGAIIGIAAGGVALLALLALALKPKKQQAHTPQYAPYQQPYSPRY